MQLFASFSKTQINDIINIRLQIKANGLNGDDKMSDDVNISWKNYDLVVKEALTVFENKTLDFLGLKLPKIIRAEETELIFLPIMKTQQPVEEFFEASIELTKTANIDKHEKSKIISMMLVLMDKYLTREKILKIWEDLAMLNIMKNIYGKRDAKRC